MHPSRHTLLPLAVAAALLSFPHAARADRVCDLGDARQRSAISELCPLKNGLARIRIAHQWGFVDADGKLAIPPQFDDVKDFSEGLAAAQVDEKWGLIDRQGKWVVQPAFFELDPFSHGLARASNGSKDGYIDAGGKWIIAPQYDFASAFTPTTAVVREAGFVDALIDRTGRVLKRFAKDVSLDTHMSRSGLIDARVSPPDMLVHVDGRRLPYPQGAQSYQDGLFIAVENINHGDTQREAYGLMDPHGTWVVPAQFSRLEPFQDRLAIAAPYQAESTDSRYGLIDRKGAFVVQPIYDALGRHAWGYEGRRANSKTVHDVLDANGKLMFTFECDNVTASDPEGALTVLSGCDKQWLLHHSKGLIEQFDGKWQVAAAGGHLLLTKPARDDERDGDLFALYNGEGKRVAATTPGHPFYYQHFNHVGLVSSTSAALPLLIFGNFNDGTTGFLTRDYKLVTHADWQYDSILLDYSGTGDEQAEGPLRMKGPNGFGAVDLQGTWVVAPNLSRLAGFSHGLALGTDAEYRTVLLDAAGKTYPIPDTLYRPAITGAYELTGQTEDGQVKVDLKSGKQTPVEETAEEEEVRLGDTAGGLSAVEKDGKWGLRNTAGGWVMAPSLAQQPAPLMHKERLLGWTHSGEVADETLIGLLDAQGRVLVKPRYTSLEVDEATGLLIGQTESYLHHVLAADGKPLLGPINGKYTGLGDGWFKADLEDLHGLVDGRGEWVVAPGRVEFRLDSQYYRDPRPYTLVGNGPRRQLVDWKGRVSTRDAPLALNVPEQSQWWWTESRYARDSDADTTFYGFDFKERVRLPGKAVEDNFSEGVIAFHPSDPKSEGRIGLMDDKGKLIGLYDYESVGEMVGGMAQVSKSFPVKANGTERAVGENQEVKRYGFLNRAGKLAVPLAFEQVANFSEKRATVVIGSGLAMIDEAGKVVLQGSWQCGRTPVLMDSAKNVLWPEAAKPVRSCAR